MPPLPSHTAHPGRVAGRSRLIALACLLVALPAAACGQDRSPAPPPGPERLRALWELGEPFEAFLASADARREMWHENYGAAAVPDDLRARLGALTESWRVLVVAEDWCGDSANTVPYLARLAEASDALDLRIVDSEMGRDVMRSHRTPDDRAATPTVLLLDDSFQERGCFVERPPELQAMVMAVQDSTSREEAHERVMPWYEEDGGRETMAEWVRVLEAAEAGDARCVAGVTP